MLVGVVASIVVQMTISIPHIRHNTMYPSIESVYAAIVTSTSTPASMLIIICFTTSVGAFKLQRYHVSIKLSPSCILLPDHTSPQSPFLRFPPSAKNTPRKHLLNQALVDPHLIRIPRLTPLPTRRLAGGDLQALGRQADGALDAEVLRLGALDELLAHLLEGLHLARGEGDADLVGFLCGLVSFLRGNATVVKGLGRTHGAFAEVFLGLLVGHFGRFGWGVLKVWGSGRFL